MPVLPPGGGVAICAVGRARWEVEWKKGKGKGIMDMLPDEVEKGGTEAVLRVPVGWSGDHRVVRPHPPCVRSSPADVIARRRRADRIHRDVAEIH